MKPERLLDGATAQVLGLDWLRAEVVPASPYGVRRFSELRPFCTGEERAAQARAERIAAVALALDSQKMGALRSALAAVPDAEGAIARASIGDVLSDPSFFELRRFCATITDVDALLRGSPILDALGNDGVGELRSALGAGQRNESEFYLADAFDPDLAAARAELSRVQAELDAARGRERRQAAEELGREELGDEFIVMRAELRGSLPAGVRVVREAPTYLLCELEYGDSARAALERREAAAHAAAAEEERVRERLSSVVKDHAVELRAAADALGELDVVASAAAFAQRFQCAAAEVCGEPVLELECARYLPLEEELAAAGRPYTPLDLDLNGAAVLTGPNMGGKSVALLTCGFGALCAAFGLPVPAARARIGLFAQIAWLGTGRDAHVGGLLSTFAQEVLVLKEILSRDASPLLMLVDEFARTTTPHEGKALLVALLGRLRDRRACALVATHLEGLAAAACARHLAVRGLRGIPVPPAADDVGEALAALAASMDYHITEVRAGTEAPADAIALTALLGIDRRFVDAAYRALSQ